MAGVQTTSNLSNSVRTRYIHKYLEAAKRKRVYDQLAVPYTMFSDGDGKSMDDLMAGSSIQVNFLSEMNPGTSALSQTQDITPQTLRDATASVTPTSRGEALQWSQQLDIQAYTNYTAMAYERVGENAMESIDLLAQAAATQGTWVNYGATTARSSLDAGTTGDRASDAVFREAEIELMTYNVPDFINEAGEGNVWSCIMFPAAFHDIAESGNVDSIGLYQDKGIHLNFELGKIGPFRLVSSPYAKVFWGAGADNATDVATTLNGAVNALATSIVTADNVSANVTAGRTWMVGTEETANTHYATNEPIKALSASTYTITIQGGAPNGGLRFDHASGAAVRNGDHVYPLVFGGPQSLVKVFATDVGEYGQVVGPKVSGLLDQFNSLGWKYFGQYALLTTHRVFRWEVSSSYDA